MFPRVDDASGGGAGRDLLDKPCQLVDHAFWVVVEEGMSASDFADKELVLEVRSEGADHAIGYHHPVRGTEEHLQGKFACVSSSEELRRILGPHGHQCADSRGLHDGLPQVLCLYAEVDLGGVLEEPVDERLAGRERGGDVVVAIERGECVEEERTGDGRDYVGADARAAVKGDRPCNGKNVIIGYDIGDYSRRKTPSDEYGFLQSEAVHDGCEVLRVSDRCVGISGSWLVTASMATHVIANKIIISQPLVGEKPVKYHPAQREPMDKDNALLFGIAGGICIDFRAVGGGDDLTSSSSGDERKERQEQENKGR